MGDLHVTSLTGQKFDLVYEEGDYAPAFLQDVVLTGMWLGETTIFLRGGSLENSSPFVVSANGGSCKGITNPSGMDFLSTDESVFKSACDKNGRIYHIFGDCCSTSMTNMYAVDPSRKAIQFDGPLASCSSGGSGDALQNACSQGTCSSYTPTSNCSAKLDSSCSSVKPQDDTCTDCI